MDNKHCSIKIEKECYMVNPSYNNKMSIRESNFELLRLLSQFYIVLYHIFLMFIFPQSGDAIFKALQIPLHVGVVVFVLISGFFSIHATSKGFIKLIGFFLIYSLPEIIYNFLNAEDTLHSLKALLFFSNSHFWFVKTYAYLYLISPMLNQFWNESTNKKRIYMIIALGFISMYIATVLGDNSVLDGKNLVNFMFLYFVGRMINQYKYKWEQVSLKMYIFIYLSFNVLIIIGYVLFQNSILNTIIWHLCFPYSSFFLLLNSMLLFLIFGKFKFQSKIVNKFAASSLAIYLIHANRPYFIGAIGYIANLILQNSSNCLVVMVMCILLTMLTLIVAIIIDNIFSPVWNLLKRIGEITYLKLGF